MQNLFEIDINHLKFLMRDRMAKWNFFACD